MLKRFSSGGPRRAHALLPLTPIVVLLCALSAWLAAPAAAQPSFPFTDTFGPGAAQRWHAFDGKWDFAAGAARETDPKYDCGAAVEVQPDGAYWLAVRFRPESNYCGAGLFFGLPSVEKRNGGMLIRCDPEDRIIWGQFDAGGTFQFANEAIYDDDGDREQELAIAVDPAKGALNLYHHGERIATNIRAERTQGFVGMTCSGGPHTFLKFECRPAKPEELEGLKGPGLYSGIVDVIGDQERVIALRRGPEFLTVYDTHGQRKSGNLQFSDSPQGHNGDVEPVALAWDRAAENGARGVLLIASGGRSIHRLGPDLLPGKNPKIIDLDEMRATALVVDGEGRIFATDAALPGVRVFASDGKELAKFGEKGNIVSTDRSDPKSSGKFNNPRGIAIRPTAGRSPNDPVEIVVTDREAYTFIVYRFDPQKNTFEYIRNGPWMPYPGQVFFDSRGKMIMAGTFEYYRAYGALRVMNFDCPQGTALPAAAGSPQSLSAAGPHSSSDNGPQSSSAGGPQSSAAPSASVGLGVSGGPRCGTSEKIWLGHALRDMSDKIRACEGPAGPDGKPRYYIADPDKDRFEILPLDFVEKLPKFAWLPDGRVQLTLTRADGTEATTTSEPRDERSPSGSEGHGKQSPSGSEGPNRAPRASEGSPPRILCKQRDPVCETWPPATPADLTEYAVPAAPPADKTYVIDMPVLVAVFTQATNLDAKGKDAEDPLKKHPNLRDFKTDPNAVIARLKRELEPARLFYWRVSGGTLNIQFDYMTVDDPNAQIDGGWIQPTPAREMVNQARVKAGLPPIDKNHSLIGIHPMSGFDTDFTDDPGTVSGGGLTPFAYSGYALWNHGQGWLFAHEWGHQLDAYFEKSGFPDWWLNHPDGTVHIGRYGEHWDCNAFLCRRADKLNWLRFRFGTLRLVDDRDQDGLADDDLTLPLDEKRFGSDPTKKDTDDDGLSDLAEMCAGTFSSSDPRNPDTNNNGLPDGRDPLPQFRVKTQIMSTQMRDETGALGTIHNAWADAALSVQYDADTVYYTLLLRKPARTIQLPMDWNDDGWFIGQDNVYSSVDLEWPAEGKPQVKAVHNCQARIMNEGGNSVIGVTVQRPTTRAPLYPGSHIGICPRLENGGGRVAFLLDPWQLLELELR